MTSLCGVVLAVGLLEYSQFHLVFFYCVLSPIQVIFEIRFFSLNLFAYFKLLLVDVLFAELVLSLILSLLLLLFLLLLVDSAF